jgi:hypothetical protein
MICLLLRAPFSASSTSGNGFQVELMAIRGKIELLEFLPSALSAHLNLLPATVPFSEEIHRVCGLSVELLGRECGLV